MRTEMPLSDAWPELPYDAWRDTRDTLHMYVQIVGKVRLSLTPVEPEWAHIPLFVTARGLNTSPIPHPNGTFDIDVDFVDHLVSVRTARGQVEQVRLEPRSVADFYAELMRALDRAGVPAEITEVPSDMADGTPFPEDVEHASYDAEWANRFWRVLVTVDGVLKEHRARFLGKTFPVALWWGSFDIAYSRFSGAGSEHAAAGFWPGDEKTPQPAFYAYTSPRPDGIEAAQLRPDAAHWSTELGEFLLPYEAVRAAADPRRALLDFLDTTYEAGAQRAGWAAELTLS